MKTPLLRQPVKFFSFLLATVLLATSCSKSKDNNDSGFPRTVSVEYKVTSSTGLNRADISYDNETMGETDIDNAAVPFSKKVDIRLTEPSGISLSSYSGVGGNLRLEIIVNGKSVEAKDFNSTSAFASGITHTFVR